MPKIKEKRKVLGGRGVVIQHQDGTSAGCYFYRELIKGTKSYKTRKIEGVSSMDEAEQKCLEIAFELNKEPDLKLVIGNNPSTTTGATNGRNGTRDYFTGKVVGRRTKSQPIEIAMKRWIAQEQEKVDAGLLKQTTITNKELTLRLHILPYLQSIGVSQTNAIKIDTFDDYPLFRSNRTALLMKQDLALIKGFCRNYLVKNGLMNSDLLLDNAFVPKKKIKQTDLMANPAINPEDWKVIIDYVRNEWRHKFKLNNGALGWVGANIFWHFILFAKNSGMSGEEIMKLKWKQIEIVDEGRVNSKGEREKWEVCYIRTIRAKTQQAREVPVNQARELRRLKKWLEEWIEEKGAKEKGSPSTPLSITPDTLVFGNPEKHFQPFSYGYFSNRWRDDIYEPLMKQGKLKGNRFSEHPYTLYSLRTTFIEDALMRGVPVIEVAQMAGHDIQQTQRHYARLDLRKRGREITMPAIGKKQMEGEVVNLFAQDEDESK